MQGKVQYKPQGLQQGWTTNQHGVLWNCFKHSQGFYNDLRHLWAAWCRDFWKGKTFQPHGEGWNRSQLWVLSIKVQVCSYIWSFLQTFNKYFRNEFHSFAEHIVASWFLRSTKLELFGAKESKQHILIITSDFGENILLVSKHETADQFFHRLEVCLFGSVCVLTGQEDDKPKDYGFTCIITSDYK